MLKRAVNVHIQTGRDCGYPEAEAQDQVCSAIKPRTRGISCSDEGEETLVRSGSRAAIGSRWSTGDLGRGPIDDLRLFAGPELTAERPVKEDQTTDQIEEPDPILARHVQDLLPLLPGLPSDSPLEKRGILRTSV